MNCHSPDAPDARLLARVVGGLDHAHVEQVLGQPGRAQPAHDQVAVAALSRQPRAHEPLAARVVAVELEEADDAVVPVHREVRHVQVGQPRQIGAQLGRLCRPPAAARASWRAPAAASSSSAHGDRSPGRGNASRSNSTRPGRRSSAQSSPSTWQPRTARRPFVFISIGAASGAAAVGGLACRPGRTGSIAVAVTGARAARCSELTDEEKGGEKAWPQHLATIARSPRATRICRAMVGGAESG